MRPGVQGQAGGHVGISGGPSPSHPKENATLHGVFCQCLACRAGRRALKRGPAKLDTRVEKLDTPPEGLQCELGGCDRLVMGGRRGPVGRYCSRAHKAKAERALKRQVSRPVTG